MTGTFPITPPTKLVEQWEQQFLERPTINGCFIHSHIATQAARWGADQELEACCEWFQEFYETESWVDLDLRTLRAARRPKPPSLKEQALELVRRIKGAGSSWELSELSVVVRALEALDD